MEGSKSVLSRKNSKYQFYCSISCFIQVLASRARKSALSQDQILRELLLTELGNESDGNNDNYCNEFIMSEKQYSFTSDKDTSLDADTSVLFYK